MRYSKKYVPYLFIATSPSFFIVGIIYCFLFLRGEDEVLFSGLFGVDNSLKFMVGLFIIFVVYLALLYSLCYFYWTKLSYSFNENISFEKGILYKRKIFLEYENIHGIVNERTIILRMFKLSKLCLNSGNTKGIKDEVVIIDNYNIINKIEEEIREKKDLIKQKRIKEKAKLIEGKPKANTYTFKLDKKEKRVYLKNSMAYFFTNIFVGGIYFLLGFLYILAIGITIGNFFSMLGILFIILIIIRLFAHFIIYCMYYRFDVEVNPTQITLTYGFINIHKITYDKKKIKGIILNQNFIQKKNGYAAIELIMIGLDNQGNENENNNRHEIVIPFFKLDEVNKYLKFLMEDYKLGKITNFTRKDSFRFYLSIPYIVTSILFIPFIISFIYMTVVLLLLTIFYLITLLIIFIVCKMQYRNQGIDFDDTFMYFQNGAFIKKTYCVKKENVVKLEYKSTFIREKLGICNIIIDLFADMNNIVVIKMMDIDYFRELTCELKKRG